MTRQTGTQWLARRGGALALLAWGATIVGCSSQEPSVILQLPTANGQAGPLFDVSSCAGNGPDIIERACTIDSNGKTYPVSGPLWVLPEAPPYAAFFQFHPGYVPLEQNLDSTSEMPAIRVMAAPASAKAPCCGDPSVTVRPPVQVTTPGDRGLLVTITDPLPAGHEVRITLAFGQLYKAQVTPCALPSAEVCGWVNSSSFGMGFDVGVRPTQPR